MTSSESGFPRPAEPAADSTTIFSTGLFGGEAEVTEEGLGGLEALSAGSALLVVKRGPNAGKVKAEDRDVVLAALRQREETMSTGIGFGIAIPHASSDRVGEVIAAFGRSMSGIEFDSLDNAPVRFIVLFVVPRDQFQVHLRTLAAIAKLLNDRAVRESLGNAPGAEEILAIFKSRSGAK